MLEVCIFVHIYESLAVAIPETSAKHEIALRDWSKIYPRIHRTLYLSFKNSKIIYFFHNVCKIKVYPVLLFCVQQAANPGCLLEDFVRWYSPNDWIPGKETREEEEELEKIKQSRKQEVTDKVCVGKSLSNSWFVACR